MAKWLEEIEELHQVFQDFFLGLTNTLERVDQALAPEFTIVGPDGVESSRSQTMSLLQSAHQHTNVLEISVTDAALLLETDATLVARYVENHQLADRTNHRLSTVIFTREAGAPNGLQWLRVHETWLE